MNNSLLTPFVKWVGGKRQLLDDIGKLLPKDYNNYYEPFLGGGALFLSLMPKKAVVNDINSELINAYMVIKTKVDELIKSLKMHENTDSYFYRIRDFDRSDSFSALSDTERASRLIYLNKTCYNGLYRVNNAGQFNSPFGFYKNPNIVNEPVLRALHKYFNENDIAFSSCDFEVVLSNCIKGDFIYLDPPYDPVSNTANFTGYSESGFNRDTQTRLKKQCDELTKKGVKFILSNSSTDFILDLYKDFRIVKIPAKRYINCQSSKRGDVLEVLVCNYA